MSKISLRHKAFINILKLIGGRNILAKQFEAGKGSTAVPSQGVRKKYGIEDSEFKGESVWTYAGGNTLIYYIHGGGFIAGFSPFYFPMMGKIAQQSQAKLVAPDYPLFPHIDALGTHKWIKQHFDQTLKKLKPVQVVLMGDSAGANAAMVLAQDLATTKSPADKLVLLAPWIDLQMNHPDMVQHPEEQLLDGEKILLAAQRHAGDLSLKHPQISPIFGELSKLPPTWVFTGSKDLFHADIMTSIEKMQAAGTEPIVDLAEGMPHVYTLFPTPEGKAGISRIAKVVSV